jgi:hypothetical protein
MCWYVMEELSQLSQCRKNAETCDDLANRAGDVSIARQFQKLAREWRELAEQIVRSTF